MSVNVFVDSNLWLYAFALRPGEEARHERARELIEAPVRYTISEQVIAEVSINLLRKAHFAEDRLLELVESFYTRCQVVVPTLATHRTASRLRRANLFSYWDSLIVAAALGADCTTLYSEDMQHGQIVDGRLTILNPFRG
jgi:predicted nucleic acid-binding protein